MPPNCFLVKNGGKLQNISLLSQTHFFITFSTSPDVVKCARCVCLLNVSQDCKMLKKQLSFCASSLDLDT